MTNDYFDPELEKIVEYFHRIWESAILVAALELDLFTELNDAPRSAKDIADSLSIDEKGVRILLDALCPEGFIRKEGSLYQLTRISAKYLTRKSEHYPGPIHWGAANPAKWTALGRLADAVRAGKPIVEPSGDPGEFYRKLTQAIAYTSSFTVPQLAQHLDIGREDKKGWSILDVACGTGDYGRKLLEYDGTAQLTLSDLPPVLDQARTSISDEHLLARINWLPGSIFEVEYPRETYDLILLSHFLHSNPVQACQDIVARLATANKKGGYFVVHEFVPDENRCERRFPLLFAMNMYINNEGDAYTFEEIKSWMESAGYTDVEFVDTQGRSSFVIGTKV